MTNALKAAEYAGLIADVCKLERYPRFSRDLEAQVFQRLGFETTVNGRGHCMRRPGESHWCSLPHILTEFDTARAYTVNPYDQRDFYTDSRWRVALLCEVEASISMDGKTMTAWSIVLANRGCEDVHTIASNPAAALVGAWLRAHP